MPPLVDKYILDALAIIGMHLKDFNETFEYELRDPEYAASYLQYALEDGTETFLMALRDVAKANGEISEEPSRNF